MFNRIKVFLFITLLSVLVACHQEVEEVKKKDDIRPVKIITVETTNEKQSRRYPAIIQAAQTSTLSFQVGGLLKSLNVKEAQEVKKGDVIARLDQRDYKNQLDSANAQYKSAEAEYQRSVKLMATNALAKNVLEQNESLRDIAKAQLDSARKALSDTTIRAPFDGVISNVQVELLETISPGAAVVSMLSEGEMEAKINLPATVIANVPTTTDRSALVILDAKPSTPIKATFKEAVLEADVASQTYEVTFAFTTPKDLLILPGMSATVELTSSNNGGQATKPSVQLPLSAVMSEGDQQYVWTLDSETFQVSRRDIVIQPGIGENVIVTEGLNAGESIIGAGASYLAEGMKVRPWEK